MPASPILESKRHYGGAQDTSPLAMPLVKRLFDLLASSALLVTASPLLLAIMIALRLQNILLGSPGAPIFYREQRISQGELFWLRKFNVFKPGLVEGLRAQGQFIHTKILEHDPQNLTWLGRLLVRSYLDEAAQLFNVLAGDLSLVGPRPVNREVYADSLARGYTSKRVLRAGITGLTQANKHPGITITEGLKYDTEYVLFCRQHPSWQIVAFDMVIIWRTLRLMLRAQGI